MVTQGLWVYKCILILLNPLGDCIVLALVTQFLAMLGGKIAVSLEFSDEVKQIELCGFLSGPCKHSLLLWEQSEAEGELVTLTDSNGNDMPRIIMHDCSTCIVITLTLDHFRNWKLNFHLGKSLWNIALNKLNKSTRPIRRNLTRGLQAFIASLCKVQTFSDYM